MMWKSQVVNVHANVENRRGVCDSPSRGDINDDEFLSVADERQG
jgi:hypothetical protein